MDLLEVDGHQVIPSVYARTIKEFKKLITRDKGSKGDSTGKYKKMASKELAYVYFMVEPNRDKNPFISYGENIRPEKIIDAVFEKDEGWKPDKAVDAAVERWKEIRETQNVRLLNSARLAVDKVRIFFETVDLEKLDDNGKLLHDSSKLIGNLKSLSSVVDSLKDLEEKVKAEQQESSRLRGGKKLTKYNK